MSWPHVRTAERPRAGTAGRPAATSEGRRSVHPVVEQAAAYAWRLLVIALALAVLVWLVGRLRVVVVPLAVAALLSRALAPVCGWLRAQGLRPGLAAGATVVVFFVGLAGVLGLTGAAVASEFDDLGQTVTEGIDDVEDWLVDRSPFDVDRADVERWRTDIGDAVSSFVRSGDGSLMSGARVAIEVVVGAVIAIIATFFFLRDGARVRSSTLRRVSPERRELIDRTLDRAWRGLGGYLRAAVVIGAVEAVAIGIALLAVGSSLVVPVMVLTFLGGFVPIAGAVVAGAVAVLVVLVSAGTAEALIVLAVVIVVQQFADDVLAPVVYGRALRIHPLAVLLGVTAGAALFGIIGVLLAVPFLAVVVNVVGEIRDGNHQRRMTGWLVRRRRPPAADSASSSSPFSAVTTEDADEAAKPVPPR